MKGAVAGALHNLCKLRTWLDLPGYYVTRQDMAIASIIQLIQDKLIQNLDKTIDRPRGIAEASGVYFRSSQWGPSTPTLKPPLARIWLSAVTMTTTTRGRDRRLNSCADLTRLTLPKYTTLGIHGLFFLLYDTCLSADRRRRHREFLCCIAKQAMNPDLLAKLGP